MAQAANLGFPRIGKRRELKSALEARWRGDLDEPGLARQAAALRAAHWQAQREAGIAVIPSNDFSLYDQVLDMTALLGAVPAPFGPVGARQRGAVFRHGARGAGRPGAGDDQVVRHELPLHRAGIQPRPAVPAGRDEAGRRVP